eukprot:Skav228767  [mRNA]  locus=scaffold589:479025:481674:- [translate_table: standard]
MESIVDHAEGRIHQFEGTDFSSTAWSLATLQIGEEALAAIAEQVEIKISSLGPQQRLEDLLMPRCYYGLMIPVGCHHWRSY